MGNIITLTPPLTITRQEMFRAADRSELVKESTLRQHNHENDGSALGEPDSRIRRPKAAFR
ncbi:MAG: hypothetical protein ABIF82_11825 [Planctomycetota bacterium]